MQHNRDFKYGKNFKFLPNNHKCHQFRSILYWKNSEYWSQKRNQSGNIHSIEIDVYALKQSVQKLSIIYILTQAM